MIRVRRVTRSRSLGVLKTFAMAAGMFVVACAKDALVTGLRTLPDARLDLAAAALSGPSVVISQVYGGGGNSGSTLKNDFIEIHNRGTVATSIDGWSVQYASSTGSFTQVTLLSGTLAEGQYLLIQEAQGSGGTTDLPTPHINGTIAMSATAGKVGLVQGTAALNCNGTIASPCPATLVDLVGYGAANYFEGTPTAALTNTTAALRKTSGCTDTDNNAADFDIGTPSPRTTATLPVTCGESAPRVTGTVPAAGAVLADPPSIAVSFSEPVDLTGNWFTISCSVSGPHTAQVTGGPQNYMFTGFGEFAPGESCTVTVFSALVHDQDAIDPPDVMEADFSWSFSTPGEPVALPETRFSEIHYDNGGDDTDEQIEVEGPAQTDLSNWSIVLYDGNTGKAYDTQPLTGITIPATCGDRGVVVLRFAQIQNGSPDGFALMHNTEVVQFLSYEGTFSAVDGLAAGSASTDIGVVELTNSSDLSSLQLSATTGKWAGPSRRSFGRCNKDGPPLFDISFSGREPISDPALPVGFEDQLFATLVDLAGATVPTTFAWTSDTPTLASIDQNGVMHSLAAGQAIFRATASNGTTSTYWLATTVATLGGTADYAGNAEFGVPADADASDDFVITRDQYQISYNHNRNTPNWVSYEFDASHFAPDGTTVDRCDCFTHDPALPASFTHLTTADYTGAGAFAGYPIDRGHMARSFDFTSGTLDNAMSYYLSNIIPQAAAVNQGPWKILEDTLGNLARFHDKEVYVIDGVAGSKGSVKGEGKITIPAGEWKVALVMPRNHGLADVHDYRNIEDVIAVIMPNDPGPNPDWKTYKTTVDEVERVSGYDLLSLLPDKIERAVESNTKPPVAVTNGPYTSTEGAAVSLSGSGSFDGSGTIVGYSWSFGDGTSGTGEAVSHTYAQDGAYIVRLVVTDNLGVADTSFTSASVANVAPSVASFAGATLLPGETYNANGSFTDSGADPWSATVDYGDGSGFETLLLSGKTFTLAHTYIAAGTFIVTVRVSDDDVTSSRTQFVTVITVGDALEQAADMVINLAGTAGLNSGNLNALGTIIGAAQQQLVMGNTGAAINQLQSLLHQLDAMIRSGWVTAADAQPLKTMITRVIRSISI
ncbi:MAG: DNA/RNA non-specific endonuclease [Gemmatimonadota bacterium]|nr:DNA/RNA non-specific endonuclease [Gemmatimonadota bacterium]